MQPTRREILLGTAGLAFAGNAAAKAGSSEKSIITVRSKIASTTGTLRFAGEEYHCMVGRSGILHPKHEGDGGTPAGRFPLREVRYRPDRGAPPVTHLPVYKVTSTDGWCDDPEDPAYNRIVHMPYQTDAETMWRDDGAYDVLAIIGYNDAPPIPAAGSAIFMHVMRIDAAGAPLPTTGCVSLQHADLLAVLANCSAETMIDMRAI